MIFSFRSELRKTSPIKWELMWLRVGAFLIWRSFLGLIQTNCLESTSAMSLMLVPRREKVDISSPSPGTVEPPSTSMILGKTTFITPTCQVCTYICLVTWDGISFCSFLVGKALIEGCFLTSPNIWARRGQQTTRLG